MTQQGDPHPPTPALSGSSDNLSPLRADPIQDILPSGSDLRLPGWLPPVLFVVLAVLFLWRATLAGDVLLPAGLLGQMAPWTSHSAAPTEAWNPLRWDSIAQFYPWRLFAARTVDAGLLPLWNPYQFCGTPFVANSQSAVLYPLNVLFYLLPVPYAFGYSAALHLALCGWFTYLLARRLRVTEVAALLAGCVYAFSSWEVAWLQLPTFLCTSCWFPLLLLAVVQLLTPPYRSAPAAAVAAVAGAMLLAGHLQIAFYGLLAAALLGACLVASMRCSLRLRARGAALIAAGIASGFLLAAPQLLPTLELSRVSHRAGGPSAAGYRAYTEYALAPGGLAVAFLPEFFGRDTDAGNPYWGYYRKSVAGGYTSARHNAAETAMYVGVLPGALALLAVALGYRRRAVLFFAALALLSLLVSIGSPVDALLYFGVPGFGQTGSPARALVLWALSAALLAGFGLDLLLARRASLRAVAGVWIAWFLAAALALWLGFCAAGEAPPGSPASDAIAGRIGAGWIRFGLAISFSLAIFVAGAIASAKRSTGAARTEPGTARALPRYLGAAAIVVALADLFGAGVDTNPTAPPDAVYPSTPGIRFVQAHAGHERIFPVNQRWSLYTTPPAVLPPNSAMVYALRDVQGYDSLFTGQYKQFANLFARPTPTGFVDASPPEVGNMIFFQNARSPLVPQTASLFVVTLSPSSSAFAPSAAPQAEPAYEAENEIAVYPVTGALPRAQLTTPEGAAQQGASVIWEEDGPTRLLLTTAADKPGVLAIRDQFYPGWTARIDGRPIAVDRLASEPIFRAVPLSAGRHTVEMRYEPAAYRFGLFLACGAVLCIASQLTCAALPVARRHAHSLQGDAA